MIEKTEYEKIARLIFNGISILLISLGLSVQVVFLVWRIGLKSENSSIDSLTLLEGTLNAELSVFGTALLFAGIIIKTLNSYLSKKFCKTL